MQPKTFKLRRSVELSYLLRYLSITEKSTPPSYSILIVFHVGNGLHRGMTGGKGYKRTRKTQIVE